ncbi:hypothetical protein [Psychrobacter celer]|uniref:hypothetical protein n=1 Tax=Psychrobacter celer TaxID=306572 RepID=UPI003FD2CDF4
MKGIFKNESYYSQFNNCDSIKNNFDYLTVPEAAIIWCGVPRSELAFELGQCKVKGTGNALSRNIMKHPYIQCVEPRCVLLHQAFDDGKLKMGRDGEKGGDIVSMGHISPDRRTIKINDLKEFIAEYHADDMPKTLFSDIDIHKLKPITHDDYSALLAKNKALEARLEKATEVYYNQRDEILQYKSEQASITANDEELTTRSQNLAAKIILALIDIADLDKNSPPYQYDNPSSNNSIIYDQIKANGMKVSPQKIGYWLDLAINQATDE